MDKLKEYQRGDGAKIIFDLDTYFEIAITCLEEFANKSREEAIHVLQNGFFSDKNFPPKTYNEVALLDNELIYDVAMQSLYGDSYWTHRNYVPIGLDKYYEWESRIVMEKGLDQYYFDYNNFVDHR